MCERWLARWRGDRCVLFASGLGLAVLCGCCVVGVLVGALCASGGWHIAGGVGWMALWVAFWAVMCEWLLAHWATALCRPGLVPTSPCKGLRRWRLYACACKVVSCGRL